MDVKFAVLGIPEHTAYHEVKWTNGDGRALIGSISDCMAPTEAQFWIREYGQQVWREMTKEQFLFLVVRPTPRPGVRDQEHEELTTRCQWAWYAYQFSRPRWPQYGSSWIVEGHAKRANDTLTEIDTPGWSEQARLYIPYYRDRNSYASSFPPYPTSPLDDWPERWKQWDAALQAVPNLTKNPQRPIELAIVAYSQALRVGLLDYSVPNYVRCAEYLVALRRGEGAVHFAQRVLRLVPEVTTDPFLQWNVQAETELKKLYQLRSDCVHGKDPLMGMRNAGDERVARYEYAAELVANRVLWWAVQNAARLSIHSTRQALESAWATGDLP